MERTTVAHVLGALTWSGLVAAGVLAQGNPAGIPGNATALEGVPTIKVETGEDATRRRTLTKAEAATETLAIRVVDGRYYWARRGNRPLTLTAAGEMTYLSSTEPGAVRAATEDQGQAVLRRAPRHGAAEHHLLG